MKLPEYYKKKPNETEEERFWRYYLYKDTFFLIICLPILLWMLWVLYRGWN